MAVPRQVGQNRLRGLSFRSFIHLCQTSEGHLMIPIPNPVAEPLPYRQTINLYRHVGQQTRAT